jgi:hypothetical protein
MKVGVLITVLAFVAACVDDNVFTVRGEFYYPLGHLTKEMFVKDLLKEITLNHGKIKLKYEMANVQKQVDNKEVKTLASGVPIAYKSDTVSEFEFNIYFIIPCQNVKYLIGTSDFTKSTYCDYIQEGIEGKPKCLKQLASVVDTILKGLSRG